MHESTLLKLALITAVLGVLVLFIISKMVSLPHSPILEKDKSYDIQGTIGRITQRDAVTFIDLQKEDTITVVLFKKYPVDLHQGDYIEVKGTAKEDNNSNMQFIGNEVRVIK